MSCSYVRVVLCISLAACSSAGGFAPMSHAVPLGVTAPSSTDQILYSFTGGSDGYLPEAPLVVDKSGDLYGTTDFGGSTLGNCTPNGCGVVFEVTPSGSESVLHTFTGGPKDGASPEAGLLRDASGDLYGTTANGGKENSGIVFEITAAGQEKILYSFCPKYPDCSDGKIPRASLIMDSSGNLYGTTYDGGNTNGNCGSAYSGCGVAFEVTKSGKERVLHAFAGAPKDGANPEAALLLIGKTLYGTTAHGGEMKPACGGASSLGCGVVFSLTLQGSEKVLHPFSAGKSDGGGPAAPLIAGPAGTLLGTASYGGATNSGVIFKVATTGKEVVLYSFKGGTKDGSYPSAALYRNAKGDLFGTASQSGAGGDGTVFEYTSKGKESTLHNFTGTPDGSIPSASLLPFGNALYSTTAEGGEFNKGAVFSVP